MSAPGSIQVNSGGVRLAVRRFGGTGDVVLLLHGIAGHSGEWSMLASQVTSARDAIAPDLRGHGSSERRTSDTTPQAFCSDAIAVIRAVGHERAHVVGQSFGGHIAFLVAAWHPEYVSSLVVVEADPEGPKPEAFESASSWLSSWPRPFSSRQAALDFFSSMASPQTWVAGLEEREDGLWPRFDNEVVLGALARITARCWWDEWRSITCPTWVVRGDTGDLPLTLATEMATSLPDAKVVTIASAGHDVHLDHAGSLASVVIEP